MERGQNQLALAQVLRPVQDEDRMRADQGLEDRGVGLTGAEYVIVAAEDGLHQFRAADVDQVDAERPVTVASLVFDFRNLARLISHVLPGPLVIGIDELDKVTDPEIMRALLREIKGIFEIPGVFFFVAMSEEAAGALQRGPLLAPGCRRWPA
jgi:hypothetical protein